MLSSLVSSLATANSQQIAAVNAVTSPAQAANQNTDTLSTASTDAEAAAKRKKIITYAVGAIVALLAVRWMFKR